MREVWGNRDERDEKRGEWQKEGEGSKEKQRERGKERNRFFSLLIRSLMIFRKNSIIK